MLERRRSQRKWRRRRSEVDAGGGPAVFIRGIFGWIYRKNLERAVPLLIQEIEGAVAAKP